MIPVSVIIPAYNAESTLKKCLSSIQRQTFRGKYEVIIIDDGSTDKTGEISDNFAAKCNRFKVVHQPNKGILQSRLTGLLASSGDFVCFVDSDDWVEPDYLETLYTMKKKTQCDVSICGVYFDMGNETQNNGKLLSFDVTTYFLREPLPELVHGMIYDGRPFSRTILASLWGKMFNRKDLLVYLLSVDKSIKIGEDAAITYSVIMHSSSISVCNKRLYHYRINTSSMTHRYSPDYIRLSKVLYYYLLKQNSSCVYYDFTKQIEGNYISMIVSAVSNLFQENAPNFRKQICSIKSVCSDDEVLTLLSSFDFSMFDLKERIVCQLIKLRMATLLYIYEKIIQIVKHIFLRFLNLTDMGK